MEEITEISKFIRDIAIVDSIPEMEGRLDVAIGYSQRIGELLNEAELNYSVKKAECLNKLRDMEDETETTRKTKLDSWVAEERKLWKDLKNMQTHLRQRIMSLMQAIKTRREEPR